MAEIYRNQVVEESIELARTDDTNGSNSPVALRYDTGMNTEADMLSTQVNQRVEENSNSERNPNHTKEGKMLNFSNSLNLNFNNCKSIMIDYILYDIFLQF